jgi:hypothetical protein
LHCKAMLALQSNACIAKQCLHCKAMHEPNLAVFSSIENHSQPNDCFNPKQYEDG